jgi:hypothetical protein
MWIKEYNTGKYIQLDRSTFVSHKHFYQELMRIKYNYIITSPNTLEEVKDRLQQAVQQKQSYEKYTE